MDGTLDGSTKAAVGANGLSADVKAIVGTAADGGSLPATTYAVSGYDGTNVQVIKTDVNGIVQTAQNGTVTVSGTVTANAGSGTMAVSGTVGANVTPTTSGGLTISKTISAASTNATSVKASAGQVYGWFVSNINASPRYLKLYNKASAPTVGTDVPVMTILIPGNASGAGTNVEFTNGVAFATGIALALTTGVADADTGAVAANDLVVNLLYK